MNSTFKDEEIAEVAHNINASFRLVAAEYAQFWRELPPEAWERVDSLRQVKLLRENPDLSPQQEHEAWMRERIQHGWSWGAERNADRKQNPLLVEWDELPGAYRARSIASFQVIRTMLGT